MAGAMRKMAVYLGLVEDETYDGQGYDPDDDYDADPEPIRTGRTEDLRPAAAERPAPAPVAHIAPQERKRTPLTPLNTRHISVGVFCVLIGG
ncbi:hypothetical protein ABZ641_36925, partial [Kitasatospora sp. NPDC007106]